MAARIGEDLQPIETPAVGEGERFVEDDRLPGARTWLGPPRATGGGVGAAVGPPSLGVLVVGRGQQIEDRLGAIALAWPHRLRHVLVAEDVAVLIARIVLDQA